MRLIDGPVPWILLVGAVILSVVAVVQWPRSWFRRVVPVVAAVAAVAAAAVSFAVHHVGGLIADATDDYSRWLDVLAAAAILLLGMAIVGWSRREWRAGALTLAAGLAVALVAGDRAAIRYGYPPDLNTLMGREVHGAHRFDRARFSRPPTAPTTTVSPAATGAPTRTSAPPTNDAAGREHGELLSQVPIAGTVSGFTARPAYIYLPPAYFASPRPSLPVMVLLAGVPGQPKNWLDGLDAQKVFTSYARAHDGLAPILVFPDYTGGFADDRGCIDSAQGHIETYLTVDVPAFVASTFGAVAGPSHWGIGGFSDGGTCALMVGLRHPEVYGPIVSFSGDSSPSYNGAQDQYIARFLGGDTKAFAAHDPLSLLRTPHLPATTTIYLEAGDREPKKEAQTQALAQAAQVAGIPTQLVTKSGQHNFDFWRQCVVDAAPWIAEQLHAVP